MSRISILTEEEDLRWLFTTHLKDHESANNQLLIEAAIIYGNEDWPDKIELFSYYGGPTPNPCFVISPVYPDPNKEKEPCRIKIPKSFFNRSSWARPATGCL